MLLIPVVDIIAGIGIVGDWLALPWSSGLHGGECVL